MINPMVEYKSDKNLSELLKAMSDTTRRSLLTQLCQQGASRVTDLADYYDMSLNAISKHIKVLESAGLVSRTQLGREHLIEANLAPVSVVEDWFLELRSIWEIRLEKLAELLAEGIEMSELSLNVSRTITAPTETVYNAWLNPELLAQFMIAGEGMSVPKVETDPREGGRFMLIMAAGDQELPHGGEYQKLDPYSQIIFTWESPFSADGSTVTLNFNEVDEGTNVELVHVKFIDDNSRNQHEMGWAAILAQLDAVLG